MDDDAEARPATADARVDEAIDRLRDLDDLDPARHPDKYEEIRRALSDVLDAPDPAPREQ